jgi:hypothetical protein
MPTRKTGRNLEDHFREHGGELGARDIAAYDASAQETCRIGEMFGYEDRRTGARRVGYYDRVTRRFVATDEYDRIVSHFVADAGYVDDLREEDG